MPPRHFDQVPRRAGLLQPNHRRHQVRLRQILDPDVARVKHEVTLRGPAPAKRGYLDPMARNGGLVPRFLVPDASSRMYRVLFTTP